MKKAVVFMLCICLAAAMAGCSKSDSSSQEDSSAAAAEKESVELLKRIDEQDKLIKEQGDKLDKAEKIFNTMFGTSGTQSVFSEDFNFDDAIGLMNGEAHPIYDDTAVVDAYKTGDSSKLTDDKDKFILEEATKLIKENIKDSMSEYEKEKAVYEIVFKSSHYDEGNLAAIPHTADNSHTPYGVLHDHSAICVGNATTFKLFMDMLGIECKIIHSTESGEHAWDLVKIDGDWYHVDVTFDTGSTAPTYSHLNLTDAAKEDAGYPWDHDEFPAATSVKYSYAAMNAKEVDTFYDTAELFKKAISKKQTSSYFKLKLSDTEKKNEGTAAYYNTLIGEISYQLGGGQCDCMGVQGFVSDGYYYGGISIIFPNENDDDEREDEKEYDFSNIQLDYDKLYKAYLDTFGISIDTSVFSESGRSNGYEDYEDYQVELGAKR